MLRQSGALVWLVGALALALALAAGAPAADARAQADNSLASLTIYTAICPVGYAGDDFFGDCYDNPGTDIAFLLTGPTFPEAVTNSTNTNGITAFEGIDQAGEYLLQIDVPLDFADFAAFCSDEFGDPFPRADESAVGGIGLDLTLDDDLRCDFYVIPEDLSGLPPTPQPTQAPATSTVGTLPNTGTGPAGGPGSPVWRLVVAMALTVVAGVGLAVGRARVLSASASDHR